MKRFKKYIPIGIVCFIICIMAIILGIRYFSNLKDDKKEKLNEVSSNYIVQDDTVMMLYNRYHPEDDILFGIIGSDSVDDYYGYYYRKDKVSYQDLPSVLKNMILFHDADYKTGLYDEDDRCYRMSYDDFKIIYDKLYGNDDLEFVFDDKFFPKVIQKDDGLCIGENQESNYTKTLDTYFVNGFYQNDKIIIYEVVSFVKVNDKTIEFYQDYDMKNLVYKLDKKDVDMSFIHDSKKVSNVLLKYQNKFSIYQYTYVKGKDTYYLESISK